MTPLRADPNILILEDDPVASYFARSVLGSESSRIYVAQTIAEARTTIEDATMDLVLVDLLLPDGDGREFLTELRTNPATATVPVIVVTSTAGAQARIDCYALGADSYFEKPIEGPVLRAAAAQALRRAAATRREALRDPVTDAVNRAGFTQAVNAHGADPRRIGASCAALLDIDRFRAVNTIRGHEAGDAMLAGVARAISGAAAPDDVVARWAGDQFAVLMPSTDLAAAMDRVEAMRTAVHTPFAVTMSAGVVEMPVGATAAGVMTDLEAELYRAKAAGRDRVASRHVGTPMAPRTILVAEDDRVIATLLQHRLAKAGFNVIHAPDGRSAMEMLATARPDLAIIDVLMPDVDGFELLEHLRSLPDHAETPVLLLTSLASESDVERGLSLGANDYVVKPFSPLELLARVQRLLGR
ncbi:MAG: response regulator [Gemmatimonadaceae bacterium]|nr:response regulator [Gemmatimonadaceae bacterium]